jgi:hypothetical protein
VISFESVKDQVTVAVTGLSKEALAGLTGLAPTAEKWSKALEVFVDRGKENRKDQPAMLGSYQVDRGTLRFVPRFPIKKGVRYRAEFRPSALPGGAGKKAIEVILLLPKPASKPTTVVTQVYPTADKLPENQLKFYLHFSAPMREGSGYTHIKLLDAKGKAIEIPFLVTDQELWAPGGKRFTLFLNPGRIKRGLKPREEVGPVLEEGKKYTLVIDKAWQDAEGNPLKEGYRKSFSVGAPEERQVFTRDWKIKPPSAGTRGALRVTFPRSMDHALLNRMVWLADASNKKLAGKVEVTEKETVWSFTPEKSWVPGTYHLVADTQLEDLAGNSIARPFEVDVLRKVERTIKAETVKVEIKVK